ncbi:MAG: ABC transporter permease [Thermoleophilia bacterium]|nr:ABC transporter permease [Thermoleophilia bacterium]
MFFTYIYRELRRRHRQALLTALGLAVGVGLVVAVSAYTTGVGEAQEEVLESLYGVGTDITVTRAAEEGTGGPAEFGMNPGERQEQGERFSRDRVLTLRGQQIIAEDRIDQIAALDDVAAAAGGLTLTVMHVEGEFAEMVPGQGQNQSPGEGETPEVRPSQAPIEIETYSIAGIDVTQQAIGPLSSAEIVDGRTFASDETDAEVMLVESGYAQQNDLAVGDTVVIDDVTYEILGLLTSSSGASNLYIPLAGAQELADEVGVNHIYVQAHSAESIGGVQESIETVFPAATVTTAEDLAEQVSGSLASASKLADQLGTWLSVVALITAFLVASLLTVSSVSRRVREFGTLKALGWRSRRIVGQVLGESLVQGVAGGVLGVGIGVGSAWLIARSSPSLEASVGSAAAAVGPGAGMGAGGVGEAVRETLTAASTVTVELGAPVSVELVLIAVGLAVAGGLLAGAFGGWRAARLRPADALRRID